MRGRPGNAVIVRVMGWALYGALVAVAAISRSADISHALRILLSDAMTLLIPIALTLGGATLLTLRTGQTERRLWLHIAAISALLLASEVYFTWYTTNIDPRGPEVPAPFQLLQLAAVILVICVLVMMTNFGSAPRRSVVRFGFDMLGGMILLAAAVYWFFTLPMNLAVPGGTWQAAAVAAVNPVIGLTIVVFMGAATAGGRSYRWRSWERLIDMAFLLTGVGLVLSPIGYVQMKTAPSPEYSIWISVALGLGYYLLFMATVYRLTSRDEDSDLEAWFFPRLGPKWFPMFYPILLAASLPVLGAAALRIGENKLGLPITVSAVSLAIVLVLRSWLMSSETVLHRKQANTDLVSGAFNYRYLRQRLASDLVYAQAIASPVSVITIGIEGLRTITNIGGSAEVDRVHTTVATDLNKDLRSDAALCRASSDTYVVIARTADAHAARVLAERLLIAAARAAESIGAHAGFSAGIAAFPVDGADVDTLLARSGAAQAVSAASDGPVVVVFDERLENDDSSASRLAIARTRSRRATTRVLAMAVDARDPDTRRHSENVADLASALALVLDLPPERAHVLDLAAQMHDVGKIGVPDRVLCIEGPLAPEQRELVEQHTLLGERILASARLDEILPSVRSHHERWDGTGYPDGLAGNDIPLEARILAVCDSYESMTTQHSYGPNFSVEDAVAEIGRCSGTQFDPDIAAPFCRMISQIHGASPRDRAGRGDADQEDGRAGS